ncbi:ABC transporter substrate-binding protein [Paenibacillus sp. OAS669]|uniref:ABC transporter substrate-binding protein n=1 Tax=Paenibacillus sp. OAS669 TaxID=2663821 RepID=UPI00178B94E6|nr:extracellular solute-binding protein [Paenibacillus sp. OAS669]MBE1441034.1 multiple sugar transport system substrate-binding protein [Paenibacillus sp. OAS669]
MKKQLLIGFTCMTLAAATGCQTGSGGEAASKEKPKSKDGRTVVTLSLMGSDWYFDEMEKLFEQKHPDIDLQIQVYKQGEAEWAEGDFEKYIKTTNSAILSGTGADIFDLSSLPVSKYVDKKLLLDMNGMPDKLNKSDLHMNILDALKINGGLYTIPTSFYAGVFVGNGDLLDKTIKVDDKSWTWEQFEEVSRKFMQQSNGKGDRYALANYAPEHFLNILVENNSTDFIDPATRKAKFDSPLFVQNMKRIKKMYDDRIMTANKAQIGNQLFYSTYLLSPLDVAETAYRFYPNPKLLQRPHPQGHKDGSTFLVRNQLGIRAHSAVKEEAQQFIAFLLSEEAQSLPNREGFSMLKSVNDKQIGDVQKQAAGGSYKLPSGESVKTSEKPFVELKQLINTANRFAKTDNKVLDIVKEESQSFFSGQKTAEDAAKLIQNRATTYLNE